jgi:hypothetical protein
MVDPTKTVSALQEKLAKMGKTPAPVSSAGTYLWSYQCIAWSATRTGGRARRCGQQDSKSKHFLSNFFLFYTVYLTRATKLDIKCLILSKSYKNVHLNF